MKRRTLLVALTLLATLPSLAQDQGIYEAEVPADYTFVRVVDIEGAIGTTGSISGLNFTTGQSGASDYVGVAPGQRVLEANGESWTVTIPAAKILTIVFSADAEPLVIEDIISDEPTKATLALYNLSDFDVSMSTFIKQDVEIFPPTAPNTSVYRTINSATIPIKIIQDGTVIADLADQAIQRRTIVSYFVFAVDGGISVATQVDRTRG